jgi:hypothetical protein
VPEGTGYGGVSPGEIYAGDYGRTGMSPAPSAPVAPVPVPGKEAVRLMGSGKRFPDETEREEWSAWESRGLEPDPGVPLRALRDVALGAQTEYVTLLEMFNTFYNIL